jgi:hypothetical protein
MEDTKKQRQEQGVNKMINAFDDVQKFGQTNVDSAMKAWGEWNRNWQAIAAEMGEYSKRSLEDGTATFQKLIGAKTLDQAFEIQSNYARRAYEQYFQEMNKIGGMYAGIAKDAMKPVERMMQSGAGR